MGSEERDDGVRGKGRGSEERDDGVRGKGRGSEERRGMMV